MKKTLTILGMAMIISFMSCDNEDPKPKDVTPPTISLVSPTDADFYQDIMMIMVEASDDDSVEVVEIYFDGTKIHDQTSIGTGYGLNTTQFEDGEHVLKVVAKDFAGNEASDQKTVNLLNTVITLN